MLMARQIKKKSTPLSSRLDGLDGWPIMADQRYLRLR
jgi:hypothetical protein